MCAVGLGPVVEELLYRERLLEALRGVGVGFAVASTSLLSALSHPEPWGRLAALVLGVGLGLVRFRSRSTAACIGHHAGLNAAALHCWSTPGCEGLPAPFSALVGGACLAIALWWRRVALRPVLLGALLAAPAGAEVLLFEGELSYEPVAAAIPALTVAGVGVATVNESGGGIALETLALAGGPTGLTGSAIVPITDPVVSNGGIVALGMSAAVGAGTLRPFQPTSPSVGRQLTQATLPVAGDLRLCMLIPSCSVPFGIGLSTPGGAGVGVGGGNFDLVSFNNHQSVTF